MRPSYFRPRAAETGRMRVARVLRRLLPAAAGLLALQLAVAGPAQAAGGDLDPAFGTGGKVLTDVPGFDEEASGVVVQPDGKIVTGGSVTSSLDIGTDDFALARHQPDGTPDLSFGGLGIVTLDFSGTNLGDGINSIALQPDGKIVAAGSSRVGVDSLLALARFLPDGTLDPSFGAGGKVTTDFGGGSSGADAVVVQPDGKIVAAGRALVSGSDDFAVARFLPDGTLDLGFGAGGKVTTDILGFDTGEAAALQSDGKIVVSGQACGGVCIFTLVRYRPDGSLDPTFGSGGIVSTNFGGDVSEARAVAVQPDGKVVAAGIVVGVGNAFALARYRPDGSLDRRFANRGTLTFDINGTGGANALAIQADGKLVLGGTSSMSTSGSGVDFTLLRLTSSGRFDRRFGVDGVVITDFGGDPEFNNDSIRALAIQGDGRIVAAGTGTGSGFPSRFALARYLAS